MKRIELSSLSFENFKGIRSLQIDFNKITNVYGENATGKTTIADGFYWLLFDKDSSDRKDFEIKTLSIDNLPIHGIEHTVTGTLFVDGTKKTLQKIFKEKWTKKRGEAKEIFTGNETLFYINDIPYSQTDYKKQINEFADENIFKLITDPLYFSQKLKWQDRRNILFAMKGSISSADIINTHRELAPLIELLNVENDIDKVRKMLANKKKKLNDDLKGIPVRIDECYKSIKELDFNSMTSQLKIKVNRVNEIEQLITSHLKIDPERAEKERQYKTLNNEIANIKLKADSLFNKQIADLNSKINIKEGEIRTERAKLSSHQDQIANLETESISLEADIEKCRNEWIDTQGKEFIITDQFICPTCNRLLDAIDIEKKKTEMQENFNLQKAKELDKISVRGNGYKTRKEQIGNQITSHSNGINTSSKNIEALQLEITSLNEQIITSKPQYGDLYSELIAESATLEKELFENTMVKNSENIVEILNAEKKGLQAEIDSLKLELRQKDTNDLSRARIKELEEQERNLAGQIAELEGQEYLSDKFIKTKVGMLEEMINAKFKYVKFKLFENLINGGIQEICEPLINGVPFADANNAAKINAGIDIINTLSEHFQITAPLFIDNRESINDIIETQAQVINLIVSKDKKLKVA